jgi:IclR family transcriptional regulator, KDG regulon repressor
MCVIPSAQKVSTNFSFSHSENQEVRMVVGYSDGRVIVSVNSDSEVSSRSLGTSDFPQYHDCDLIIRLFGQEDFMKAHPKRSYDITALQRGLKLLNLFSKAQGRLTATQVAKLSGLPISTVHRFLANLVSTGFLNCSVDGGYHLGIACVSLGRSALGHLDIRRLSFPYLEELNQKTRETVHLTVRHELSAVYVEKLDSPEPLRIHSHIGAAFPLYCTGVGKVMLAYMPPEAQAAVLAQSDMRRYTQNTISNVRDLQTHLLRVRRNGYACDLEEHELHVRCVAAPIWDNTGAVNASLSITGPVVRMSMSRLRQLAPLVQQAGLGISRELGFESAALEMRRGR